MIGLEVTHALSEELCRNNVLGDFVELGVAQGGCAALLGMSLFRDQKEGQNGSSAKLWLFDSFEGLPEPTRDDYDVSAGSMETGDQCSQEPQRASSEPSVPGGRESEPILKGGVR